MRVETNWKLVRRNRKIAQYLFYFSLAVLIGGLFVFNRPTSDPSSPETALALILSSLVLPVGFITTIVSVRMTNQWIRQPRPEEAIREGLKGLSKKSVLYNYYHIPARHVLICPQGVFAMITRFQDGSYTVTGDQWKTTRGLTITRLFRQDGIGNPNEEALRAAVYLKGLLEPIAPEIGVQPLIVFVDPRARLDISDPTVPILYADDKQKPNLKDYMRDLSQQQKQKVDQPKKKGNLQNETGFAIPPDDIDDLANAFEEATFRKTK
jgi:hypothetical protein